MHTNTYSYINNWMANQKICMLAQKNCLKILDRINAGALYNTHQSKL